MNIVQKLFTLIVKIVEILKHLIKILWGFISSIVMILLGEHRTFFLNLKLLIVSFLSIILFFLTSFSALNYFEGEVITNQLTFVLDEKKNFLKGLDDLNLRKISFWGLPELELSGEKFNYKNFTELNQTKVIKLKKNEGQNITPQLEIKSSNKEQENYLEVLLIELYKSIAVNCLKYDKSRNLIELYLDFDIAKSCYFQTNYNDSKKIADIEIELGNQPFDVTLQGYEIQQPKLRNQTNSMKLEWTPKSGNKTLDFEVIHPLFIELELNEDETKDNDILLQRILSVTDTRLFHQEQKDYVTNIIKGSVRMTDQKLNIEPSQFLQFQGGKGIERLYNISLTSQGIKVLFNGTARKVLSGLNFDSPGYNIRGEFLAKFMSKEQRIAIIGFLIAIVSTLLIEWIKEFSEKLSNNNNED